jgi:hypothetical protein
MNPALRSLTNEDSLPFWIGLPVFMLPHCSFVDVDILGRGIKANERNAFSSSTKIVSKIYKNLQGISLLGLPERVSYTFFNTVI